MRKRSLIPIIYIIFLLLGSATGLLLRSGTQLGAMTFAIGYAFLYFILNMELGKELVHLGVVAPEFAAWIANLIYLVAGVWLARRVLWR